MDKKKKTPIYAVYKRLQTKGHIQTESEGGKKILHANRDQKKTEVAKLISDKINFEIKAMKRDKERHYIMIKRSIQENNNYKYICTQHRSTTICKANANKYEKGN